MTDEQKRIRTYLQAQAAKLSPAQIVDKVRAAMTELRAAAVAVPAARFAERPAPEEWSANEVMAHVVEAGQPPGAPRDAPARDTTPRPLEAWWALLEHDRAAVFARAVAADPTARLDATVEHAFFGPLNWRETLLFMRLHDLDHAGQMQKVAGALAKPR